MKKEHLIYVVQEMQLFNFKCLLSHPLDFYDVSELKVELTSYGSLGSPRVCIVKEDVNGKWFLFDGLSSITFANEVLSFIKQTEILFV